jgi:hypothetical protein
MEFFCNGKSFGFAHCNDSIFKKMLVVEGTNQQQKNEQRK